MEKLTIGDIAPGFSFTGHDGVTRSLSDYLGKKVILFFYPKDNTPGCTLEACSLRDGYDDLRSKGFEVIGVSADSASSHEGFKTRFNLPFALVSDTDKSVLNAYGVWGEKKIMGKKYMGISRTTFVIDEKGLIASIIEKVNTKDHAKQVVKEMEK
ncbi:MAG: thioredoxin-dependent thiol peroxidase [Porphyromonadaceae bacterium]|nr:MAG: thioredoxin-dependent thiol peroxidase [Porphyromonadaceae bacterium]